MCWNASVSLNTYLFSVFASIFAYMNGIIDIYHVLYYHSFISIQLTEYFIWSKTLSNEVASKISFVLILLQPILAILAAFMKTKMNNIRNILLLLYLFYLIILFIFYPPNKNNFSSSVSKNGHLIWNWMPSNILFIFAWVLFLMLPFFIVKNYLLSFFILISFIITYILYSKDKTWGSMWCWIANISSAYTIGFVFCKDLCV